MRDHQPDPADHARDRDDARRDQRGADDDHRAEPARLDAERARLLVAERQHVDPPAQQHQRDQPGQHDRRGGQDVLGLHAGQAAEQPEGDRGQLVVGIGENLEERGRGARQRAHHHPGEHQDQRAVADPHRGRDESHQRHRPEPAREPHELDRDDRQRQEDPEHRAEPGTGGDAEDVGRDQRVAEQRLVARPGRGERRAHQQRGGHPGEPDREQHGLRPPLTPAARENRNRLAQPERIGPDRQRPERAGDQGGNEPERRPRPARRQRRRLLIRSPPSPPPRIALPYPVQTDLHARWRRTTPAHGDPRPDSRQPSETRLYSSLAPRRAQGARPLAHSSRRSSSASPRSTRYQSR